MDAEGYFKKLGGKNRWILTWFLIMSFARTLPSVFSMFAFQFTSIKPKTFHCAIPWNASVDDWIPYEMVNGKRKYSTCSQYSNLTKSEIVPCLNGYNYTLEYFQTSTVTDWDLVCDRAFLNGISIGSFFVMSFVGSIISCTLSDKFGRKIIFLISFTFLNLGQFVQAFVPNVYLYIIVKLLTGIFQQGCFVTGFTFILELFSLKNRSRACLVDTFSWTISCAIVAGIAYANRYWRYYFIYTTVGMLPFCFIYFCLPESIRWLLSKKRTEEAKVLLYKAAKYSKPPLERDVFNDVDKIRVDHLNKSPVYNITHILKESLLMRYQGINMFIWFTTAMTFYGLQVKVVSIGNPFVNFLLLSIAEIPANLFAFPLADKFGRKLVIGFSSCLASILLMVGYFMSQYIQNPWFSVVVFLTGKTINTAAFNIIFMHVGEFFPTTLRTTAIGLSTSSARIGATIGSMLFQLSEEYEIVAFIITSVCCFLSAILVFCLPETYRKKIPLSIDEIKEWVKEKPLICLR